ncbi:MAG: Sialate O-acetylesterase [Verrucomicrobia bacterium]|nr:Sialate O-acetylesterase [Verrucomicrobiota bacterium]
MNLSRLLTCALGLVSLARADVTLAPLFQDHAVLQRDQPVPVWGQADAGEHVTVSFKGQQFGTTASADGRWIIYLDALVTSAEPAELVVQGKNTVTLSDILVGEVWLASGQSNMELPVRMSNNAEKEIAEANFPLLRHIKITHTVASSPSADVKSTGWRSVTPESIANSSAVGYFFAREIHRRLGVPVGLIDSSWGGTAVEAWMGAAALRETQVFPAIEARWQKDVADFPERQVKYPGEREAWAKGEEVAKATKTKNPLPYPRLPVGPGTPYEISGLFNAMIAPLQPYAMRGVIWYQGESNWTRPAEYGELFPAMIRSWRAGWGQGDFPFYFVQLANFGSFDDPTGRAWALLREAQTQALLLRATEMATAIDVGDPKDIHPRNKQEVGRRLALIAKVQAYNIPGDFSGPMFEHVAREGSALRVYFSHASTGLISHDKPVQSLEIAGADQKFYPATGKIERGTLVVTAREVKEPVAVRYAWSNAPVANLYNGAGLPAPPFRSDRW